MTINIARLRRYFETLRVIKPFSSIVRGRWNRTLPGSSAIKTRKTGETLVFLMIYGTNRVRTCDLPHVKRTLIPAELWSHFGTIMLSTHQIPNIRYYTSKLSIMQGKTWLNSVYEHSEILIFNINGWIHLMNTTIGRYLTLTNEFWYRHWSHKQAAPCFRRAPLIKKFLNFSPVDD